MLHQHVYTDRLFPKSDERSYPQCRSTGDHPVEEETVDWHVASLLDQLGVFHDYVQAVPCIG